MTKPKQYDSDYIQVGEVVFTHGPHPITRQPGWFLPGGGFTQHRDQALNLALRLNQLLLDQRG